MTQKTATNEERKKQDLIRKITIWRDGWERQLRPLARNWVDRKLGDAANSINSFYFMDPGELVDQLQREIVAMQAKIFKAGYRGRTRPRTMWIPSLYLYPTKLEVHKYIAKSVRRPTALTKKDSETIRNGESRRIYRTGHLYKLSVKTAEGTRFNSLTNFIVCVCDPDKKMPQVLQICRNGDFLV
ncbi:hypothetical protein [Janthinobacterium sp.]|uniref:hypothetical protein n=1 Tax=Janthinobacterium sp. TaxID=1871054 RepID=UPI0025C011E5|nr:hypothetical protein [Janthinobacterium sp.]